MTNINSLVLLSLQVSVSSCDLLVVSVGQMSMGRAINIVQKFWTAGIPAEIMYDWSQVEFLSPCVNCIIVLQDQCRLKPYFFGVFFCFCGGTDL